MGKMVLTVLGMVAEMELGFIKARQRDGIERAKSKGDDYKGAQTDDRSLAVQIYSTKELGQAKLRCVSRLAAVTFFPSRTVLRGGQTVFPQL